MAANNYFGFTHGGTQYGSAAPGAAYGGQTGYAVAPAAAAATYGTQRAATGYDTAYQAAAATQGTYAGNQNYNLAAHAAAAAQYDANKSYYQQAAAAAAYTAPAPPAPAYDTKPAYTTQATYAAAQNANRTQTAAAKTTYGTAYSTATPATSYAAQTYSVAQTTPKTAAQTSRTYSNYDTALYNAATMYVAQQQNKTGGNSWKSYNKNNAGNNQNQRRPKQPPKAQTLHYCDVCRISCAGPQTYREHLEGQKHKKKEAASKLAAAGAATAANVGSKSSLRCDLCDVSCTGADAYAAHVRGIKHQKVLKLHTMLGKPIPEAKPATSKDTKAVAGTAKMKFVAAGGLSTVSGTDPNVPEGNSVETEDNGHEEEDVQPVGQDYIEEVRGDDGKALSFNCKLCDCKFNDPNAKEMHMKGRRHRLQYKKKVQPDLVVNVKPSLKQRKFEEQKQQRLMMREEMWARRRMHENSMDDSVWWDEFAFEPPGYWGRPMPPHQGMVGAGGFMPSGRRQETPDDRHVMAKHAEIYPTEQELQDIQRIVSHTERALKALSDQLATQANKNITNKATPGKTSTAATPTTKKEDSNIIDKDVKKENKQEVKEDGRDNQLFSFSGDSSGRTLKGVMRVESLAKGLLLKGDKDVRLVLLSNDRPTITMLKLLASALPEHLKKIGGDECKYSVMLQAAEGAVLVSDGKINVLVSLTSPVMREANSSDDKDVLPRPPCVDALAALRHAKWFQARAATLQSCVIIIRIMRDLCRRIPNWTPLNSWAMELVVAGAIGSAGAPLSPGEALRRVMEAVAGGLLLDHGPGLLDPCEKEPVDALGTLAPQKREDLTASAQQFLRQIAFRQIHKVLDMEPLPAPKRANNTPWKFGRKRRRSQNDNEGEGKVVKTEDTKMETDTSEKK